MSRSWFPINLSFHISAACLLSLYARAVSPNKPQPDIHRALPLAVDQFISTDLKKKREHAQCDFILMLLIKKLLREPLKIFVGEVAIALLDTSQSASHEL